MLPAKPSPSRAAEPCADLLRHGHQRVGERHQPQQGETHLCASLRVGGDPAGVVVGGAGDQPRPEDAEQARLGRTDDWIRAIDRLEFGIVFSRFGHGASLTRTTSSLRPRQVNASGGMLVAMPMAASGSNNGEQSIRREQRKHLTAHWRARRTLTVLLVFATLNHSGAKLWPMIAPSEARRIVSGSICPRTTR